jgi:hypothetical protein
MASDPDPSKENWQMILGAVLGGGTVLLFVIGLLMLIFG